MATKRFEDVFKSGRIKGYKAGDVMIRDFFRDKALQTKLSGSTKQVIESTSADKRAVAIPTPGKMLLFQYDAKHKDTLPYWDAFPVIFPLELYSDSFLGMNLHYLPPVYRIRLMDALYETVSNERYDKTTRLNISYQIMKSASKFRYFKPCIKKYLNSHVRSQLIEIPSQEWDYICFLPLQKFMKAPQRKVWDDSVKSIMGN